MFVGYIHHVDHAVQTNLTTKKEKTPIRDIAFMQSQVLLSTRTVLALRYDTDTVLYRGIYPIFHHLDEEIQQLNMPYAFFVLIFKKWSKHINNKKQ